MRAREQVNVRNRRFAQIVGRLVRAREMGLVVFLALLVFVVSLRSPYFLSQENLRDILLDISILVIVAIGQAMVIITRGIDLSVSSTLALAGMVVGMTVSADWGLPPLLALAMGAAIGLGLGIVNGLIITQGQVPPIIATLGALSVYRGLVFAISGGAWVDAAEMPEGFKGLARNEVLGMPNLVLIAALVAAAAYYFLNHARTGRHIYAIGSNPQAAQVAGIPISRVTFLVYAVSGLLAGMGGVLWVSRYASAQSDTAVGFELQTVAAAVVGGVNIFGGSGTVPGVLLGSLLLGVIINALNLVRISPFWKLAVQGLVILLAVLSDVIIARRLRRTAALRRST